MSTDHEQTPRKLVYLRDHAPRARTRASRAERRPPFSRNADLVGEAAWLGRSLLAMAAGIAIYWLLIMNGAPHPEGEAWSWSVARLLAHLYVAASSALAARRLQRGSPRAPLFIAFAASSLIVVGIEGLAHAIVSADLSQLPLGARTDILSRAAMLALGVWASSYALRAERRGAVAS